MRLHFYLVFIVAVFAQSVVSAQNIYTVVGSSTGGYGGDGGPATNAKLYIPSGVTFDSLGNMYIADGSNFRIRKVSCNNVITTIAGTGVQGYSGDGGPATNAKLSLPSYVTVDSRGNIYYTDWNVQRVRKIQPDGIITTFAGNGLSGYSGDGGPATDAKISSPLGICVDRFDNVYITDGGCRGIRKITPSGIISTVAGNGIMGYGGDGGPATDATFSDPRDVAVDFAGNLYISDGVNNRVRKVSTSAIVTTIAGNGISAYTGDGGPATDATMRTPSGIAVDNLGNIYFAELYNNIIRKISNTGIISTVAGNSIAGYGGDNGPALLASFYNPYGLALDSCYNLYVADGANSRIRKIVFDTVCVRHCSSLTLGINATVAGNLSIYPNPTTNLLHITGLPGAATYRLLSMVGAAALCGELPAGGGTAPLQGLPPGIYMLELITHTGERLVRRVVKE